MKEKITIAQFFCNQCREFHNISDIEFYVDPREENLLVCEFCEDKLTKEIQEEKNEAQV